MSSSSAVTAQSAIPSPIPKAPIGTGRTRAPLHQTSSGARTPQLPSSTTPTSSSRTSTQLPSTTATARGPLGVLPESRTSDQRHSGKVRLFHQVLRICVTIALLRMVVLLATGGFIDYFFGRFFFKLINCLIL